MLDKATPIIDVYIRYPPSLEAIPRCMAQSNPGPRSMGKVTLYGLPWGITTRKMIKNLSLCPEHNSYPEVAICLELLK